MNLTLRESLLAFRRWPALSFLSVTTIGFALFVASLYGLVALNLHRTLDAIGERVEVVVYVLRGTPVEVVTVAIGEIESFPEVTEVTYVTAEQAMERAQAEMEEFQGIFSEFETNPLPASLEVRLNSEFQSPDHVRSVANRLRGYPFAEDVQYGSEWVAKLDQLRAISGVVGLLIGGAFALASVIIIGTTIRMAVMQRSKEIGIMRLVGATDSFIRRPFLVEGAIKGALGGMLAMGLCFAAFVAVNQLLSAEFFNVPQMIAVVVFGMALGLAASVVSVGKHLKNV
ncbi:MAG: ABC transporter permease [Gemmatimonadota bacterium]|nr:ABC transporter permease [Gemmatimonadota bacterium]MDH5803789.1 ABC transporter permease [Gemmatimonadota bacterium]